MKKLLMAGVALAALGSTAHAADLGAPRLVPEAVVAVPAGFNWTGFYIGLHLGGTSASTQFTDVNAAGNGPWNLVGDRFTATRTGVVAGGQLGYNWQFNNFVFGLEADLGYLGGSGNRASAISADTIGQIRSGFYATGRARAGVAVDRVLLFVTGGVIGVDHGSRVVDVLGTTLTTGTTGFRAGWTVGAGFEFALNQNWTLKADYLYYDVGRARVVGQQNGTPGPAFTYGFDTRGTGHIVRLGVNYLFTTGPSAVAVRY